MKPQVNAYNRGSRPLLASSMDHLQQLVDELAQFGSTTTNVVYSQTLPYRRPRPSQPY
jgi:Lrp/AsnC family leucine-responsive transcriptional regulator